MFLLETCTGCLGGSILQQCIVAVWCVADYASGKIQMSIFRTLIYSLLSLQSEIGWFQKHFNYALWYKVYLVPNQNRRDFSHPSGLHISNIVTGSQYTDKITPNSLSIPMDFVSSISSSTSSMSWSHPSMQKLEFCIPQKTAAMSINSEFHCNPTLHSCSGSCSLPFSLPHSLSHRMWQGHTVLLLLPGFGRWILWGIRAWGTMDITHQEYETVRWQAGLHQCQHKTLLAKRRRSDWVYSGKLRQKKQKEALCSMKTSVWVWHGQKGYWTLPWQNDLLRDTISMAFHPVKVF